MEITPCAPKDACDLGGTCKAGACQRTAVDCADADPCTTDACDPAKGCVVRLGAVKSVSIPDAEASLPKLDARIAKTVQLPRRAS